MEQERVHGKSGLCPEFECLSGLAVRRGNSGLEPRCARGGPPTPAKSKTPIRAARRYSVSVWGGFRARASGIVLTVLALALGSCGQSKSHPPSAFGSGGKSGTAADQACWTKPDPRSCLPCCESEHPDGLDAWADVFTVCLCKPTVCQNECQSSWCGDTFDLADQACEQCFEDALWSGPCSDEIDANCAADPVCDAFQKCEDACP
jgi:hypothetical protein